MYQDSIIVHTPTWEDWRHLIETLRGNDYGLTIVDSFSTWGNYGQDTCIRIDHQCIDGYAKIQFYKKDGFKIYSISEFYSLSGGENLLTRKLIKAMKEASK